MPAPSHMPFGKITYRVNAPKQPPYQGEAAHKKARGHVQNPEQIMGLPRADTEARPHGETPKGQQTNQNAKPHRQQGCHVDLHYKPLRQFRHAFGKTPLRPPRFRFGGIGNPPHYFCGDCCEFPGSSS